VNANGCVGNGIPVKATSEENVGLAPPALGGKAVKVSGLFVYKFMPV
jgi:hypothetical protein